MDFYLLLTPIIFIYSVYCYFHQRRKFKLPPGPRGFPIIGNLPNIKQVRWQCFSEWSRFYGPIVSFWIGSSLNVVVSSPELAKEALKDNDQVLANRPRFGRTSKITKDGKGLVWADYGQHYAKVRRLCVHELFSQKSLEVLRPIREEEVRDMVKFIAKDCNGTDHLVVRKYLASIAFNCITRMLFGTQFTSVDGVINEKGLEFKRIVEEANKQGGLFGILECVPWLGYIFQPKDEALEAHARRRDRLIQGIIQEHVNNSNKGCEKQFVGVLLELQEKYDLGEETIMELLWDMVTAGMDTVAISVEWAMAQLVKNQRVQEKVQEELDRVIRPDRLVTETDLSNLTYLQCLTKEALRLHPPTPLMLPHKASANVKIGGYDIPKGSILFVNVWAIARDPEAWKDPLKFRPERFLEEDIDMKGQNFKLLPFGSGRRVCPATTLSNILVTSMLGHLLHHFSWTTTKEINMEESPGLVCYMKYPLEAVPKLRLASHMYNI